MHLQHDGRKVKYRMNRTRRITALLTAVMICLSLLSAAAMAEEGEETPAVQAEEPAPAAAEPAPVSEPAAESEPEPAPAAETEPVSEPEAQDPASELEYTDPGSETPAEEPEETDSSPEGDVSSEAVGEETGYAETDTSYRVRETDSRVLQQDYYLYYADCSENADEVFQYLLDMGLSRAAACGVMANIQAESLFNPNAWGDHGTSYGLCQWHEGRFTHLKNYCSRNGYDYTTLTGQLHFLEYELKYCYSGVWRTLQNVSDTAWGAYQAAYYWCWNYEMPADTENVAVARAALAQEAYWPEYENWSLQEEEAEEVQRYKLPLLRFTGYVLQPY